MQAAPNANVPAHLDLNVEVPSSRPNQNSAHSSAVNTISESFSEDVRKPQSETSESWCKLPSSMAWLSENWTWPNLRPVIRSSTAAWLSAVLFVIPEVEIFMGQASFLILIASVLSPPSDPLIAVLERELLILLFVSTAWAWSCLGMLLANLARVEHNLTPNPRDVFAGRYIETWPTLILAIFIFIGSCLLLYVKARQGPGPYVFATVLGCICLDICLTTGALFPYPFYLLGKAILLPLTLHTAIAVLCSLIVFPQSVAAQFMVRLQGVLTPLCTTMSQHKSLLELTAEADFEDNPRGEDSESTTIDVFNETLKSLTANVGASEAALVPLSASTRLLSRDFVWGRFAPTDLHTLHNLARRISVRANGTLIYFTLAKGEKFPVTPAPSRAGSRMTTPLPSRPPSPEHSEAPESPGSPNRRSRPHVHIPSFYVHHNKHHSHSHSRDILHNSLLHLALSHPPSTPVGVFESQRYLALQVDLDLDHTGENRGYNAQTAKMLQVCCGPLLDGNQAALKMVHEWLGNVRRGTFLKWVVQSKAQRRTELKEGLTSLQLVRDQLSVVISNFRNVDRHKVAAPYLQAFQTNTDPTEEVDSTPGQRTTPPHRYLFHCYVYQYHVLEFSILLLSMLDEIIRLEMERTRVRLWTPAQRLFSWSNWQPSENLDHEDDENPDLVQGIDPVVVNELDLGFAHKRDPDALPPRNVVESAMKDVYRGFIGLTSGNALFALKAATLTIILCIPSLLKSTAQFSYENRFVWGIFMGQLTISRFRGDTTFGLVARIYATGIGAVLGMLMWYISTGSGQGQPLGLGAVFALGFPFFFYARLYIPGPPIRIIILLVTAILVVGYSYQDQHINVPGSPGYGFSVAWRRFVLVTAGVLAAFIFSFLPPSTTIRTYHRRTLATTSSELGGIYCTIISYANSKRHQDTQDIVTSLIAIRSKLKRSIALRANISYEFSLQGRWPAKRYEEIVELQLQLAYSLSHLMSVVEHLQPEWSRAFLRRTRFLDSDFIGDFLAVISMISTALRSGTPLPQITPCPLLDRFMLRHHGLSVIHAESEEDYGLPRMLTVDTVRNEQYMYVNPDRSSQLIPLQS